MFKSKIYFTNLLVSILLLWACAGSKKNKATITTSKDSVLAIIHKVNGYWQAANKPEQRSFWDVAAYHTGNMEAYKITGTEAYKTYSTQWVEFNNWQGAKGTDRSKWQYKYGETPDHVLFGDWQICF